MSRTIDARGLNCPQPVILTKKVMDENSGEEIITMVDNPTAIENVCKLASSQGYTFMVKSQGPDSYVYMNLQDPTREQDELKSRELAVLVKSDLFGEGNDELGAVLTKSFFYTLTEMSSEIQTLIFMNGGVHLTTAGSSVLEHLKYMEQQGVQILSCGTCLDFFAKKDQLEVGQVTNMYTAMEILFKAAKTLVI